MTRTLFALMVCASAFACRTAPPPAVEVPRAEPAPTEPPANAVPTRPTPCSKAWFSAVEAEFPVSDAQGHGPDLGSQEWMHALAHQQGLAGLPEVGSEGWCQQADAALFSP